MLRVQDAVLILSSSVDDLKSIVLVFNLDLFAKRVLNGGIVALDEVVVYISNGEGGFA